MQAQLRVFFLVLAFSLFCPPVIVKAANVSIPNMELMTWGRVENDAYSLYSRAYLELLIDGGYKFGGRAEFMFDDRDLEQQQKLPDTYNANDVDQALQKNLLLKSISVETRRLFDLPLSLVYFSGTTDIFGNGDTFQRQYGSYAFASTVKGYGYFPTGVIYDGLYTVKGTGLKLHIPDLSDWMNIAVYTYQDGYLGVGKYSSDLRGIFNLENLKIEAFVGTTYPNTDSGIYRGGLLFFYSTGLGGEFYTQIGVPRWDPAVDKSFNIDLFYFLFEPRVRINLFSIVLTFFWHPEYYNQIVTDETGTVDIFVKFLYGDPRRTQANGGIENRFSLQTQSGDQIVYKLSPFLSVVTSGVIWDFKVNVRLYPYKQNELIETFIGIKTEL